ncbi:unnamed protein product, partial [Brassica oleracea var. botrytis]
MLVLLSFETKSMFPLVRCFGAEFLFRSTDFEHGERVSLRRVRWCAKECLILFVYGHNSPTFQIQIHYQSGDQQKVYLQISSWDPGSDESDDYSSDTSDGEPGDASSAMFQRSRASP